MLAIQIKSQTEIGEDVSIRQGAAIGRNCTIGDLCEIGFCSTLGDGVQLGRSVFVGAGTVGQLTLQLGRSARNLNRFEWRRVLGYLSRRELRFWMHTQ